MRTRTAARGMVCSVDHLATGAGVRVLASGGNAADAAIATSAALAVTAQHMCGMGGDLWALVHTPGDEAPTALNASGRAGSGADADELRAEGHTVMPFRLDSRSVTIPGCVDGWLTLHERHGRLPLGDVLAPAIELAEHGFPASPLLAAAVAGLPDEVPGGEDLVEPGRRIVSGDIVRRPRQAQALRDVVERGRSAWYLGGFGDGLRRVNPQISAADLDVVQAEWVDPLMVEAWGHGVWTVPPNSQGYLSLAAARIADGLDLGGVDDDRWAHLLVESAKQAGFDRPEVLADGADGHALVSDTRLDPRRAAIDPDRALELAAPAHDGDTIYLCAVDGDRMGVSLIQSNAAGFGSHLAVGEAGVFLHNRGIGFSLVPGSPAAFTAGRRPPSTLAPALVTHRDGSLRTVLGTMGGDAQPQVVLQMLARLLDLGQSPGAILTAPRWTLTVPEAHGFDTWSDPASLTVALEPGTGWHDGLARRGHRVVETRWGDGSGHAHLIDLVGDHLAGAADPRSIIGSAGGL